MMNFRSNGKVLLTGEYVILDNALSLSLPTQLGQTQNVSKINADYNFWKSINTEGKIWLEVKFNSDLEIVESSDSEKAAYLMTVLAEAQKLNPKDLRGYEIITQLEFPTNFGLGSSSTFINNIAQWYEINAFSLHFRVSNGSGYDIANAQFGTAITYLLNDQNPIVNKVNFSPPFKDHLYFIHLNKKQISSSSVKNYKNQVSTEERSVAANEISSITKEVLEVTELKGFEELLRKHETLISHLLEFDTITETHFRDYDKGVIKSLGAWGGDFILVSASHPDDLQYFKSKGYHTIFAYKDFIL